MDPDKATGYIEPGAWADDLFGCSLWFLWAVILAIIGYTTGLLTGVIK